MDLRGQLAVIRAHRLLVIGCVVVAVLTAMAVTYVMPRVYQSRATLIVGQSLSTANPDIGQIDTAQRLSATYARIATTRPLLEAVISNLGLDVTADELLGDVSAESELNSTLLAITVNQPDPDDAASIANEIGDLLIAASPAVRGEQTDVEEFVLSELRTLQGQIEAAQAERDQLVALDERTPEQDQRLSTLEAQLNSLRATYATLHAQSVSSAANQLSVVEPAVPEPTPTSPSVILNLVLALLAGGLVGVGAAFLIEYLADSVKTEEDATLATGMSVLATIPRMRDLPRGNPIYSLATIVYPRSSAAESFRMLRTNLEFSGVDVPLKKIVVTSALPREGKTTIACNLAVAFAQAGRRTLLVDADLRLPGVHKVFDLHNGIGFTDLLRSDAVSPDSTMHATQDVNLRVITSGPLPPNPAELLGSARMHVVMRQLTRGVDVIVIDAPPVNVVTDAVLLAKIADGTILVIESGKTRRASAQAAAQALSHVGVRLLGVTLNSHQQAATSSYSYYEETGSAAGAHRAEQRAQEHPSAEPRP